MGKKIHLTFSGSWKASGPGELEVAHLCFLWIRVSEGKHFFPGGKWQTEHSLPAAGEKSYQMASSSVQSENCSVH
ncbi:MAG: hypothetical protein L6W00_06160 [Lentisphaeria bacterium]|nr:MAG: hypothetical protein L6W00_06160 [Lentisphaeria bacterium]